MADIESLPALPRMGPAFARALLPASRGPVRVPDRTARVAGHRQDLARLADYSRVCGFTLRDHVPPTWIHVLTFPLHVHLLGDPASSIRLVGAVHVSNRMSLHRPVAVTDALTLDVRVDRLRPHARGALVDLVGTARVGDEPVWEGVSTYLSAGVAVPGEPEATVREAFAPEPPLARWRLPGDLGRRYRRVSQDPNLIHTSRLAARAFGFDRPIIHGMWTHARALAALDGRLPDAYSVDASFVKPILLPSTVGYRAERSEAGFRTVVTTADGSRPHLFMSVAGAA